MCSISVCPSFLPSLFLLLFAASPLALGSKHLDKAPAGLRPAKAVDEQPGSGGGEVRGKTERGRRESAWGWREGTGQTGRESVKPVSENGQAQPNTEPIPFGLVHNESTRRRSPVVFRKHRVHPPADSPTPSIHLTVINFFLIFCNF